MAISGITEHYTSRITTETVRGSTLERVFTMTFDKYDYDFDIFVGNLLGDSDLDTGTNGMSSETLRVTQIQQCTIGDNTNAHITVFYSTFNSPSIESIPDAANSWEESIDISVVDEAVTTFKDQDPGATANTFVDWGTYWGENKPEGAADTAPEMIIRKPNWVFSVTAYATTFYVNRISNMLGRINGKPFLVNYFSLPPQDNLPTDIPNTADDSNEWLFTACPITRTGTNVWRYDFIFEHNDATYGWNETGGIDVWKYSNLNPFTGSKFDFNDLFAGMDDNISTDISVRTGRG